MTSTAIKRGSYAVGLILYHPDKNLKKRISLMISQGYQIFIFDNSPDKEQQYLNYYENDSVFYVTAGKNVGIGYSLATLCATAYMRGVSHLLFLDQDTGITAQTLEFIEDYVSSVDDSSHQHYAATVFNGNISDKSYIQDVPLAISSGSLFNLRVLSQIGWHNEKFFVDCVDYEFCLRARRLGFKIGLIENTPDFDHVTEQPDRIIIVFGKRLLVRRYSVARISDAVSAYFKLIFGGILQNRPRDSFSIIRSLIIYLLGQTMSRLTRGK